MRACGYLSLVACTCLGCDGLVTGDLPAREPDAGADRNADANIQPGRRAQVRSTGGVGLNLRAEASTDSDVLRVLPDLAVLDVQGEADDDFLPVRYRLVEGWAHTDFLDLLEPDDEATASDGFNFLLPWAEGVSFPVTQGHGGGSHTGINYWAWDFGLPTGTPVHAAHAGVVRSSRSGSSTGGCSPDFVHLANYVTIDRGDGLETTYVHLGSTEVEDGQVVVRGERIGTSGATGYVCGAHLHFQVQISPDGGGTTAGANQSVRAFLWDQESPSDPAAGSTVESRNGSASVP